MWVVYGYAHGKGAAHYFLVRQLLCFIRGTYFLGFEIFYVSAFCSL